MFFSNRFIDFFFFLSGPRITKTRFYHTDSCLLKYVLGSSCYGTREMNPTRNHEIASSICGLARWVKDLAIGCELWCRSQMRLRSDVAEAVV